MRHLVIVAFLALWLSPTLAFAQYKYKEGDCITPTNETWSWYKGFASVKGVFERKDADYYGGNTVYLLHIVKGASKWTRFQGTQQSVYDLRSIDDNTQKVPVWMCERNQSG